MNLDLDLFWFSEIVIEEDDDDDDDEEDDYDALKNEVDYW